MRRGDMQKGAHRGVRVQEGDRGRCEQQQQWEWEQASMARPVLGQVDRLRFECRREREEGEGRGGLGRGTGGRSAVVGQQQQQ